MTTLLDSPAGAAVENTRSVGHPVTFAPAALAAFAAAYPDFPAPLTHGLADHPLLTVDAIAALADRLPGAQVEYNPGKLPLSITAEDTPRPTLSIAQTIRTIGDNGSWMVLKNVESDPAYAALLDAALEPLRAVVESRTGPMAHREAFIFLTSPGSVTPFHMDPEHNILLQIAGGKVMTVFPAGDTMLVPAEKSEGFALGAHRNLVWDEVFRDRGTAVPLEPGDAILVPVKAPHFVHNGDRVSISFSITWRSERSVAEGELHSFNRLLRACGLPLVRVSARPERQKLARLGYRLMRRLVA
ncbi:transcriptional regulator [Sphingobium sufflavum]|uniref:cupin-like domain-containing protein n=1 Tax=Sphingobium sufflavum TaxID=1129547 RepID=UPI001F336B1E|nr:cupin-like domain-containing protein [Sphingobium sufflavum]MCE7797703.1 transcriptional regulator [Sphingobium sufflavum]